MLVFRRIGRSNVLNSHKALHFWEELHLLVFWTARCNPNHNHPPPPCWAPINRGWCQKPVTNFGHPQISGVPCQKMKYLKKKRKHVFLVKFKTWIPVSPDTDLFLKIFLMRGQSKHNLAFLFPWVWRGFNYEDDQLTVLDPWSNSQPSIDSPQLTARCGRW